MTEKHNKLCLNHEYQRGPIKKPLIKTENWKALCFTTDRKAILLMLKKPNAALDVQKHTEEAIFNKINFFIRILCFTDHNSILKTTSKTVAKLPEHNLYSKLNKYRNCNQF